MQSAVRAGRDHPGSAGDEEGGERGHEDCSKLFLAGEFDFETARTKDMLETQAGRMHFVEMVF